MSRVYLQATSCVQIFVFFEGGSRGQVRGCMYRFFTCTCTGCALLAHTADSYPPNVTSADALLGYGHLLRVMLVITSLAWRLASHPSLILLLPRLHKSPRLDSDRLHTPFLHLYGWWLSTVTLLKTATLHSAQGCCAVLSVPSGSEQQQTQDAYPL